MLPKLPEQSRPALGIEADILFAQSCYRVMGKKIVAQSPTGAQRGECPKIHAAR
jgi:hypothetical protein